ncbi:unnamed protein product [Chrysoparadoxa australica]
MPDRFVSGVHGDLEEAKRRWEIALRWRREHRIWEVLKEPRREFELLKKTFPTYICGRAKNDCPVLWERIGESNILLLDTVENLNEDDLVRHYLFHFEFLWGVVEPGVESKMITIEDVQGVGIRHLTLRLKNFVSYLSASVKPYYVDRCQKSYIINAPWVFSAVWKIISPFFDPRTREKVNILGYDWLEEVLKDIDASQIPESMGGTLQRELHDSDEERKLRALVDKNNAAGASAAAAAAAAVKTPLEAKDAPPQPPAASPEAATPPLVGS